MGMSPEQWERVKELYEAALECSPTQRAAFLQKREKDPSVRAEVLRLLSAQDDQGSFLSTPPFIDPRHEFAPASERLVAGEVLADRFRIIDFLAAGGMGASGGYALTTGRAGRVNSGASEHPAASSPRPIAHPAARDHSARHLRDVRPAVRAAPDRVTSRATPGGASSSDGKFIVLLALGSIIACGIGMNMASSLGSSLHCAGAGAAAGFGAAARPTLNHAA